MKTGILSCNFDWAKLNHDKEIETAEIPTIQALVGSHSTAAKGPDIVHPCGFKESRA
jgi:hypothetical protein